MAIKLFITGGTIDCERIEAGKKYHFGETYIPEILRQARCQVNMESQVLFMKDSIHVTDEDREKILQRCKNCEENKIIITHGTDTLSLTAQTLGRDIKDKIIVLSGASVPYNQKKSDALFNLGSAVCAVQTLTKGVYVAMHGRIFPWNNVRKNKKTGLFESIE